MIGLSVRAFTSPAAGGNLLARRHGRAAIEPMLPAVIRGVIFVATLATPFVAALLTR